MIQLSIIIPVYNCASYLKKGFEVLKPLYGSEICFEIIYINDGSTDNSLHILKEIEANNEFVKVLDQENQGSSGARNSAIEIAKGKYIQFLDADDKFEVESIIELLHIAVKNNFDCLGYGMDFIEESGRTLGKMPKHPIKYGELLSGSQALIGGYQPSSICVFLFKTSFLNEHHLRIYPKITHMDVEFMTRVMIAATSVIFIDKICYHYLQREGSITKPKDSKSLEKFLFDEVIISELIKNNLNNSMSDELKIAIQKNYNSVVWNLLWRFLVKPKEVSLAFKIKCLEELKSKKLYPIKGPLKTNFQRILRLFFNSPIYRSVFLKIRS